MWQDIVIMVVSLLFSVMLLPQLHDAIEGKAQTNRLTSVSTGSGLVVMGSCYITLGLVLSAMSVFLTAFVWFLLALDWRSIAI